MLTVESAKCLLYPGKCVLYGDLVGDIELDGMQGAFQASLALEFLDSVLGAGLASAGHEDGVTRRTGPDCLCNAVPYATICTSDEDDSGCHCERHERGQNI